jgi:Family of unknown function (DUF5690)
MVAGSRAQNHGWGVSAWCIAAAFGSYLCMYAFRKPFTAGTYAESPLAGIGFKSVLVISQVLGYTVSKFIGIKVVSEIAPSKRAGMLLLLIGTAELALFFFAVTPAPYNAVWLFFNGLPLGMVFGMVLGFLEGRRQTEAMTAGLCTSFIVADGVVKSIGTWLLNQGVGTYWMPFVCGALFVPPLLLFVWMLARIPRPSERDVANRAERVPMTGVDRWAMFRRYWFGLTLLMVVYLLVTILRSLRGDYALEIWQGLGVEVDANLFTWTEMAVAFGVLVLCGSTMFIATHRRAFFTAMGLAMAGSALVLFALFALREGLISPFSFVVLHGLGLYLPYIAVHTTIFERLIAMTRDKGNIGYLMYLVDAFGYLGYVLVLLCKNLLQPGEQFLPFFLGISWVIAGASLTLLIPCWRFFATHPATRPNHLPTETPVGSAEGVA